MEESLRSDADSRAQYLLQYDKSTKTKENTPVKSVQQSISIGYSDDLEITSSSRFSNGNNGVHTADAARLAAIEFKVNGRRARADYDNFVGPRWELDQEVLNCRQCNDKFDFFNRRHHCRHCGKIFCGKCSPLKLMLPLEFNQPDPQRVCIECSEILIPIQDELAQHTANHQRINYLELAPGAMRRYLNMPIALTLGSEIRKASYSLINLFSPDFVNDSKIPLELLKNAKGLLFLTVFKCGFGFGIRFGTGLIMSRLADGTWSAPSSVGCIGINWGFIMGAEITDYVVILNNEEALLPFTSFVQLSLGMEIDIAAGPIGRSGALDVQLGQRGAACAYSYSHSRGVYVGATLDGSIMFPRNDINHRFYGREYSPVDLLCGRVTRPIAAEPLYDAIEKALSHAGY